MLDNVLRYAYLVYQGLIQEVRDLQDFGDMMLKRNIANFASTTIKFRKFKDIIVYLLLPADMCLPWNVLYSGDYSRHRRLPLILCTTNQGPDSKVHRANMGPIWGRQDPGGLHVGPMNFAIQGHMYVVSALLDFLVFT